MRVIPLPVIKNDSVGLLYEQEFVSKGPSGPSTLALRTLASLGTKLCKRHLTFPVCSTLSRAHGSVEGTDLKLADLSLSSSLAT